ncbi:ABC transporter ATP-binding protein [Hydrogenibacillus sp. N12]|uniref:ABC transporter ATP-binding protein n=1 Tax=Hydrogenibacillus sp. N12 TaxID=2866627 RepID=UPI001C7DE7FE|nr:ABC transporter ATP-binding protein [Hydrogenibacillus sp. N12]QZA32545.1 ABC transporter ATP-binding protein [Hydrogenibacillus sp. N12]
MAERLLEVEDLVVSFRTYAGKVHAVRGVSFAVDAGETLAIVGESGSGKSVTVQAVMRLLTTPPAVIERGRIRYGGRDLLALSEREMQDVRGREIGMIFQDPMTSLNPTMTVGRQIAEGVIRHQKLSRSAALEEAVRLLGEVGIPNPEVRIKQYPHQFSGGMRQRAMIAMAIANRPKIVIADEPTTALDVTIQAQILELLVEMQRTHGMAIILITHDLGVVAKMAHRVAVMYAGQILEAGSVDDLFYRPRHPYTWGLLNSIPRIDAGERKPLVSIPGSPPNLIDPPKGCPFAPRCPYAMEICVRRMPEETPVPPSGVPLSEAGAPETVGRTAADARSSGDADASHRPTAVRKTGRSAAGAGHTVRCWLMHPMAPKVEPPIAAGRESRV